MTETTTKLTTRDLAYRVADALADRLANGADGEEVKALAEAYATLMYVEYTHG